MSQVRHGIQNWPYQGGRVGVSNELSEGYRVMNPVFYTRRPVKNHSWDIKIALTLLILVLETRPG